MPPLIVVAIISALVSGAMMFLMPRPKQPKPQIENAQVPEAVVGKRIPVLFGTRLIENVNVLWYGDLRIQPIKAPKGKK